MQEKPPAFLLYLNEVLGSPHIDNLDNDQFTWTVILWARMWHSSNPCHLPNDPEVLYELSRARMTRFPFKRFTEKLPRVLNGFDISEDGKWIYSSKLLNQWIELGEKYKKRADAAQKRWSSNADAMHQQSNANKTKQNKTNKNPKALRDTAPESLEKFRTVKSLLERFWKVNNEGSEMPWDGSEAKALHDLIAAWPEISEEKATRCIANRAQSEDINLSERPRKWIRNLPDYLNSPLDRFGKPLRESNWASVGISR